MVDFVHHPMAPTSLFRVGLGSVIREPYENIGIGNFLYSLGLSNGLRSQGRPPAGIVNLLQQTPLDRPLGDVLVEFPGIVRLIEFKRLAANSTKEFHKLDALRVAIDGRPDLVELSREIHWYVELRPEAELFFSRPYLYFDNHHDALVGLDALVANILDTVYDEDATEPDFELIKIYLRAVSQYSRARKGESSAVLVSASAAGGIHYVVVDELQDLALNHDLLLRHDLDQKREMRWERLLRESRQLEQQRVRQHEHKRTRGRSR